MADSNSSTDSVSIDVETIYLGGKVPFSSSFSLSVCPLFN